MRHKTSGAIEKHDAVASKPLYQSWSLNGLVRLIKRAYALLVKSSRGVPDAVALAAGRRITSPRYCESVQIQREARRAELYARRRLDRAGHVAGEPCILSDRSRCGDGAADRFLEDGLRGQCDTCKRENT